MRHVGHRRAGAGDLPVDHPGHRAPPPQDVAGMEVPVHQHHRQVRRRVMADLRGPLPHVRVPGPARRLVAGLRIRGEGPEPAGGQAGCGVDDRQGLGQVPQPALDIRWPPVDPARQPRH